MMSFPANETPEGTGVYVWLSVLRITPGVGSRKESYLSRWPAMLSALTKEQQIQFGVESATHMLIGPVWPGKLVESGDLITSLKGRRSGHEYVRSGKDWTVAGRRHVLEEGERSHQVAFVREVT